jgi:Flavin containing amine oxidoreductase
LHHNVIKFTPALPTSVQKAISNLGFGVLEKLFIHFSEPWWLLPVPKEESTGIEWYHFKSHLDQFPNGFLNFISLARTHHPIPVFGIFVATDFAKFLVLKSKEDLKIMLETYYIPHLPNYDAKNPACQILQVDCSTWSQDPLSGFGSYTHIPRGSDSGNENMRILSERILSAGNGGGVWFAGEHTADTEIIGGLNYSTMATVTGAYKTGERAGKNILKTHNENI